VVRVEVPEDAKSPVVDYREIDPDEAGQRLDNYLLARLKGVPRSRVYRLIRSGQVRVNRGRSPPSYRLRSGDLVRIPPVRKRSARTESGSGTELAWLSERIVFENDRLLVLDKPAGLAVHGGHSVSLGCIEALRLLRPACKTLELVHRLDRDTSGCLLVAKKRSTLRQLHALLREGQVEKSYLALVRGDWQQGRVVSEQPLHVVHGSGGAQVKATADGKFARSEFRLVDRLGGVASLLEVRIATGRTHQIRVHAAELGFPIAGDERYGDRAFNRRLASAGLKRMFLHAQSVFFEWPNGGGVFTASVALPEELRQFLDHGLPRVR
jgi:23S rRNA pseudouridine955/2504/2580 synthase